MPTIIHKNFTDPEIHEPKDVSTASNGEVYVADGAGSGSWKYAVPQGWGKYHDSTGAQALSTTATKITIDGLGADTDETHLPLVIRGLDSLWDTSANEITPINEGDSYACYLDFDVTNLSTANNLTLELDQGGLASPSDVVTAFTLSTPATGNASIFFMFPAESAMMTNGGQIFMKADAGTPEISGVKLFINRMYDGTL